MKNKNEKIVARFAPSPTGFLHIGGARTALFNYLFARNMGGKFVLRIEDTDKERSTKEFEKSILETIDWLGFEYDEIYRQSERNEIYKKYLEKLIKEGEAFVSKEELKEPGDRSEVIRFKNPNKRIIFKDIIRGEISFDTTELGDFVIAKSLDEPIFHFANVVDDYEMGITHIIRGEEHISNTPRQILIAEAIGASVFTYAHIPLILAKDRSKLSKRHGAVSVTEYRDKGYLPEALNNYLALLGWNPGGDKEIFSKNELIKLFSLDKIQKGGAIFDEEKLKWVNKEHLTSLSEETKINEIRKRFKNVHEEILKRAVPTVMERIQLWGDLDLMFENGEIDYLYNEPKYAKESLLWKNEKDFPKTKERLEKVLEIVSSFSEKDFDQEKLKEKIWPFAEKEGKGSVLWPLRFALSGKEKSPDPFSLLYILGKDVSEKRIKNAIAILK